MADKRVRSDFIIKDLVVSLPSATGGGAGSTWLPADDGEPLPWWISPVASVLIKGHVLEAVTATVTDALKQGSDLNPIASAFEGDPEGSPAIRQAIHEIGSAVVAGAAYAAVGASGGVGMPDPNCNGTSLETIPPTLTPVVHKGIEIHRVSELPRLRKQLAVTMEVLDKAAKAQAPRGDEVKTVAAHLQSALSGLGAVAT
jgi:hypothetical protein